MYTPPCPEREISQVVTSKTLVDDTVKVDAFIPAVLAARTILMHVSVEQGAQEGQSFQFYVDFLVAGGFVPPNANSWVDHIRQKGNAATHRVDLMTRDDAEKVLRFIEMILLFIYEYPNTA